MNASNCHPWSEDVKVLLMELGCCKFILCTLYVFFLKRQLTRTLETTIFEKIKHTQRYLSKSKEYRKLISDTDDGKQAWNKLKTRFEPSTRARIVALLDEFFSSSGKNTYSGKINQISGDSAEAYRIEIKIPDSYNEVQKSPLRDKSQKAMEDEMQVIQDRYVWNLLPKSQPKSFKRCMGLHT
ncbi:hypothetical protein AVEN_47345-1 [Araneus ventricosus]|uniref:Uncharacterized protein n=1 Tax=Araneus ventricosus TaxID=182803 RepID=A0A4Y2FAB1_ARAVE|nr:hypothetical protein AVEN_47345-1 [Araneus ventricosus]